MSNDVSSTTTTEIRQVTLRIRHHGEPESDISAQFPRVTLRSVSSMTGGDGRRKRIIELSGNRDHTEGFLTEFRKADSIVAAEPLTPLSDENVYVIFVYDVSKWDSISETLSEMGVHYKTGTTIVAGWERWTIYLEDPGELSRIIRQFRASGNEVELVSNVEMSELSSSNRPHAEEMLVDLTPRQRDALAAAVAVDYYDYDGDGTIADIAEELGVAETTAWEHITRAESRVMHHVEEFSSIDENFAD